MDHWKRNVAARETAWSLLTDGLGCDAALLQECVVPRAMPRSRFVYRELGGTRPWGSSVAIFEPSYEIEEIGTVRTRYGSTRFSMLGTYPGSIIVTRVTIPKIGPITCVSVYGLINVYAQTTMLRAVADLIPLFDSPDGERVVLGGDFNVSNACRPDAAEFKRYNAILKSLSLSGC